MPDFPQIIPTPAQMEALSATLQRFGRARQVSVDQIVDAFHGLHAYPYVSAFYVVPTEQDARAFFDPSLGEPWEEQADG